MVFDLTSRVILDKGIPGPTDHVSYAKNPLLLSIVLVGLWFIGILILAYSDPHIFG